MSCFSGTVERMKSFGGVAHGFDPGPYLLDLLGSGQNVHRLPQLFGATFRASKTLSAPATVTALAMTADFSASLRTTPFKVTWPLTVTIFTLWASTDSVLSAITLRR